MSPAGTDDWTDLQPEAPAGADDWQDVAQPAAGVDRWSAGTEAANALTLGLVPYANAAGASAGNLLTGRPADYSGELANEQSQRTQWMQEHPFAGAGVDALFATPTLERFAAASGLNKLRQIPYAGKLVAGAATGALAGDMSSLLTGGDPLHNTETGAIIGSILPGAGLLLKPFNMLLPHIAPEVAEMARKASQLGVRLRPGQIAKSELLQKADQFLAGRYNEQQVEDYTRAWSRTIGEDTSELTPGVIDDAEDRLGREFNTIGNQSQVKFTPFLKANLYKIYNSLATSGAVPKSELKSVEDALDGIESAAGGNNGIIPGSIYQSLSKRGSMLQNLSKSSNADVRNAGGQIADELLTHLHLSSPPGTQSKLLELRDQFKNLKILQKAAADSPSGVLNPQQLAKAAKNAPWSSDAKVLSDTGRFLPKTTPQGGVVEQHRAGLVSRFLAPLVGLEAFHQLQPFMHMSPAEIGGIAVGTAGVMGARRLGGALMNSESFRRAALGLPAPAGVNFLGGTVPLAATVGVNSLTGP